MNWMDRYRLGQELAQLSREEEWEPYLLAHCPDDPGLRGRLLARRRALAETPGLEQVGSIAEVLTSASDLTGSMVADRYQILEKKAVGGMGAVYRARDTRLGDIVALKVVKIAEHVWDDEEARHRRDRLIERFTRERTVQSRLKLPTIVHVRDAGRTPDDRPFFVMDWVDGLPLGEYCAARALPLRERLVLFQQICQAVEYAHDHLVLHRDLKLSNVLVTDDGQARLLDFGVAKELDDEGPGLTAADRGLLATPEYLSPEQVQGAPASMRSDQFALGIMLYHLLTGESPYHEELSRRLASAATGDGGAATEGTRELTFGQLPLDQIPAVILNTEISHPSRVAARRGRAAAVPVPVPAELLTGDLDQITLCAIHHDPDHRYDSVADLRKDIDRYFRKEPVIARAPTLWYTSARFIRRNRARVITAAAVIAALIVGLAVSVYQRNAAVASGQRADAALERTRDLLSDALVVQSTDPDLTPGRSLELALSALKSSPHLHAARYRVAALLRESEHVQRTFKDIRTAMFDRSGQRVLVAAGTQALVLTLTLDDVAVVDHGVSVSSIALDAERSQLAVGSSDGKVSLWSIGEAKPRLSFERRYGAGVTGLTFATGGGLVVAGGRNVEHWSADNTVLSRRTFFGEVVELSRTGTRILIDEGNRFVLADAMNGERLRTFDSGLLRAARFSATGEELTVVQDGNQIRRYRTDSGEPASWRITHPRDLFRCDLATESIVACETYGGLVDFRARDGFPSRSAIEVPSMAGLAAHPLTNRVVAWTANEIGIWDTGEFQLRTGAGGADEATGASMYLQADGGMKLVGRMMTVKAFNDAIVVTTGNNEREIARWPYVMKQHDSRIVISADGRVVAAGRAAERDDAVTTVWRSDDLGTFTSIDMPGRLLALSRDGQTVALERNHMMLRDTRSGAILREFEAYADERSKPTDAAFNADGSVFLVSMGDSSIIFGNRSLSKATDVRAFQTGLVVTEPSNVLLERAVSGQRIAALPDQSSLTTFGDFLTWIRRTPARRCEEGCCLASATYPFSVAGATGVLRFTGRDRPNDEMPEICSGHLQLSLPGALFLVFNRWAMRQVSVVDVNNDSNSEIVWFSSGFVEPGSNRTASVHVAQPGSKFSIHTGGVWRTIARLDIYGDPVSERAGKAQVRAALVFRDLDGDSRRETACYIDHTPASGALVITHAQRFGADGTLRSVAASECRRATATTELIIEATPAHDLSVRSYAASTSPLPWSSALIQEKPTIDWDAAQRQ